MSILIIVFVLLIYNKSKHLEHEFLRFSYREDLLLVILPFFFFSFLFFLSLTRWILRAWCCLWHVVGTACSSKPFILHIFFLILLVVGNYSPFSFARATSTKNIMIYYRGKTSCHLSVLNQICMLSKLVLSCSLAYDNLSLKMF